MSSIIDLQSIAGEAAEKLKLGWVQDLRLTDTPIVRPPREGDEEQIQEYWERFKVEDPESLYLRFFGIPGDLRKSWMSASSLGNPEAHDVITVRPYSVTRVIRELARLRLGLDKEVLGQASSMEVPRAEGKPKTTEIAYAVSKSNRGRGHCGQMLSLLLEEDGEAGVKEILANTLPNNSSGIGVLNHLPEILANSGSNFTVEEGTLKATYESGTGEVDYRGILAELPEPPSRLSVVRNTLARAAGHLPLLSALERAA